MNHPPLRGRFKNKGYVFKNKRVGQAKADGQD